MSTASLFDERAREYDMWYLDHSITAENEVRLIRYVAEIQDPCIEIGVGSGYFASRLGCRFGVDPSLMMLNIAVDRGINVVAGRGEKLPLKTGIFKTALIIVTICFLDDPIEALREAYRILEAGGILVTCIVPAEAPLGQYYKKLGSTGHPFYSKARFITTDSLVNMLEEAGFKVESIKATITYMPWESERLEDPKDYTGSEGFICIKARK